MNRSATMTLILLPCLLLGGLFTVRAMDDEQTTPKRGWLGVSITDMTPKRAKSMHVKTNEGALVENVMDESPAEKAGVKSDDIILEFNGKKVTDADDLRETVRTTKPGTSVSILVSRQDKKKTLKATLDAAPDWRAVPPLPHIPPVPHVEVPVPRFRFSISTNSYGLRVIDLTRQLGKYFGAPGGRGALVEEVQEGSVADSAGFQAGDVIVKVQDEPITHARDIWDALEEVKKGDTASVEVVRRGNSQKLSLRVNETPHHGSCPRFHSFEMPGLDNREFKLDMENLKKELQEMGRQIESQTRQWKKELQDDLRHRAT